MKALLGIFFLWSCTASAYNCPAGMTADQEKLRRWLHPWGGTHELQNCRVEVTVCTAGPTDDDTQIVAEVFIIDAKGREAYVPISLAQSEKIEAQADFYPRTMFYLKRDKYYETQNGRTETSRLEITLNKKGIESLDLGVYATKKRLRGPSKSRWYNCGLGAD